MLYTPYEDINKLLRRLAAGLQELLGPNLIGFYLTGSLTYGDFNRESSDIDFLVVMKNTLPADEIHKVQELHKNISNTFPEWSKRIEGSYITKSMLTSIDPPKEKRPYVNAGKMWQFAYGNEWVINKYALYICGKAIYGPEPQRIMTPVTIEQVREASRRDLEQDWLPKVQIPNAFHDPDYDSSHLQAYAVLTLCRILYRHHYDDVSSKKAASSWVKKTYPEWKNLVEKAEQWYHGQLLNEEQKIKNFIMFVNENLA